MLVNQQVKLLGWVCFHNQNLNLHETINKLFVRWIINWFLYQIWTIPMISIQFEFQEFDVQIELHPNFIAATSLPLLSSYKLWWWGSSFSFFLFWSNPSPITTLILGIVLQIFCSSVPSISHLVTIIAGVPSVGPLFWTWRAFVYGVLKEMNLMARL